MATTTLTTTTTVGTLKLNGSATPKRRQADPDSLAHACVVADDLITQLNHLNESLMTALERLRTENTQLHRKQKSLGVEVQTATRSMRMWRMFSFLAFFLILFAALTPYAIALAVENGFDQIVLEGVERVRFESNELMARVMALQK